MRRATQPGRVAPPAESRQGYPPIFPDVNPDSASAAHRPPERRLSKEGRKFGKQEERRSDQAAQWRIRRPRPWMAQGPLVFLLGKQEVRKARRGANERRELEGTFLPSCFPQRKPVHRSPAVSAKAARRNAPGPRPSSLHSVESAGPPGAGKDQDKISCLPGSFLLSLWVVPAEDRPKLGPIPGRPPPRPPPPSSVRRRSGPVPARRP
jgi:hypothetical protein